MTLRTRLLIIGVSVGLVTMAVGLYEASERNRDVMAYAGQECAHLEKFTPNIAAGFDPHASCMRESANQHALKPGSEWFIYGGAIIVICASLYWRTRPRSAHA